MSRRISLLVVSALLVAAGTLCAESKTPDLVVVISVDQMRADYLTRFEPWFSDGGFKRLMHEGAYFPNAAHRHSITLTAPGHATIGSALDPRDHGIAANDWFDRIADTPVYCVGDPQAEPSTESTDHSSPWRLVDRGLGDAVKKHDRLSKVIGVSKKDRAAVLMAGRSADAAYWFDEHPGAFLSSSYYEWNPDVLSFNETLPARFDTHKEWALSGIIPPGELEKATFDPEELRRYKRDRDGLGTSFPHPIGNLDALVGSPFFDAIVIDFAMHIIKVEKLGTADGHPDVLFVGPSSLDYYGHNFGPDSMEVADGIVRLDRDIERFLDFLEENFAGRYTVALTSDHGVQQIPEVAKAQGKKAGRFGFANPGHLAQTMSDLAPDRLALERAIARELEIEFHEDAAIENAVIRFHAASGLYLNWSKVANHGLDPEVARKAVKACVLRLEGVRAAFTASELLAVTPPKTNLELAVRRGYRPDLSPDVVVILEPGYISRSSMGTTHGQPTEADMRVPVALYGVGIEKGTRKDAVSPADMTHSLGAILGVDVGSDDTRVLPGVIPGG